MLSLQVSYWACNWWSSWVNQYLTCVQHTNIKTTKFKFPRPRCGNRNTKRGKLFYSTKPRLWQSTGASRISFHEPTAVTSLLTRIAKDHCQREELWRTHRLTFEQFILSKALHTRLRVSRKFKICAWVLNKLRVIKTILAFWWKLIIKKLIMKPWNLCS